MQINITSLSNQLNQYLQYLQELNEILKIHKKEFIPGSLHISGTADKYSYYRRSGKEQYLSPKKEMSLIRKLAQQDYEKKLLKEVEEQLKVIESTLRKFPQRELEDIYSSMLETRKSLVLPHVPDRETEIRKWEETEFVPKEISDKYPTFLTNRGERVRSRAEKIIADQYYFLGIPYRYECPLYLEDNIIIHPDFTVLNTRTMTEYYHEHLGRMDDPGYANKVVSRLALYQNNGIFPGEKLLLTYESGMIPFKTELLMSMIDHYLV